MRGRLGGGGLLQPGGRQGQAKGVKSILAMRDGGQTANDTS